MIRSPAQAVGASDMIEGVAHCARAIDDAFNSVAERLGEGLTLFEGLKSSFGALSSELAGEDMEATRAMLARLAKELRAFAEALPAETQMLLEMAETETIASAAFAQLREHLQLIALLSRSTRIEAASLNLYREDIGSFTERIMSLTTQARDTVDSNLRSYGRLTSLLKSALAHQQEFSSRYRAELEKGAANLEQAVGLLADRAAHSAAFTADATERTQRLSRSVGAAIVSMQAGDNIRQRLEHAVAALELADRPGDGPGRDGLVFAIRHLQAHQLREAHARLDEEVAGVDSTLALLASDSQAMTDFGRKLSSGQGDASNSLLDTLYADLADASSLIAKCHGARQFVDQATQALIGMVDQFHQTQTGLSETIEDIVMIGTNAGLLAGRLGVSGRGLVVIATEVKAVASLIVRDASQLAPLFESLQASSGKLRRAESGAEPDMASLDASIRKALERMRASGVRLESALQGLAAGAGEFGAIVGDCRQRFSDLSTACAYVSAASDFLFRETSGPRPDLSIHAAEIGEELRRRVFAVYTMVEERDLYRRVVEEGLGAGPAPQRELRRAAG